MDFTNTEPPKMDSLSPAFEVTLSRIVEQAVNKAISVFNDKLEQQSSQIASLVKDNKELNDRLDQLNTIHAQLRKLWKNLNNMVGAMRCDS